MTHKKLVAMTMSPTRYTKIIRNPGAGTKYNRTHQEVDYVSRYTKTVAGGKDYVPPAPPGPEVEDPDPITVVTPPEWDDKNVYRVGETIGCTTAIFEGGLPPFVTCNYRWQARKDGAVIETDKVEYGNEAITISGVIPAGCTEVRMWCNAADDLDGDPDVDSLTKMNSFSVVKTIEPEFNPPLVATKAQMSELNVYEIGETIEAFSATWREGNPDNQIYRSRWQYRETEDASWVNESWTTHVNQQVKFEKQLDVAGIYRFNTQVRDSTVEPDYALNSFSSAKTVDPLPTTIGILSITVDDVPVVWGEAIHVPVNTSVHVVVTHTGDAQPTYKWEARGDYPLMVGSQAATTTLTFPAEGGPTVTLTVTDSTATDSPLTYAMNFYVASQTEWDMLHPTTTN